MPDLVRGWLMVLPPAWIGGTRPGASRILGFCKFRVFDHGGCSLLLAEVGHLLGSGNLHARLGKYTPGSVQRLLPCAYTLILSVQSGVVRSHDEEEFNPPYGEDGSLWSYIYEIEYEIDYLLKSE
jgi:hypothetical protein